MNAKMTGIFQIQPKGSVNMSRGADSIAWKTRNAMEEQRKLLKKRLFGEHYNYTRVGLNKEKKYLLQQQKNTEIERQNLILLQKIQKIARKMPLQKPSKRFNTQLEVTVEQIDMSAITNNAKINGRRYEKTPSSSQDGQIKQSFSSFSVKKSARLSRKYLFKGRIETAGKSFDIKPYFQDDRYVIQITLSDAVQKIRVRRQDYTQVYNSLLDKDHRNIVNLLKFNGKIFELQQVESEVEVEKQVRLPMIEHRQVLRHKTEGSLQQ